MDESVSLAFLERSSARVGLVVNAAQRSLIKQFVSRSTFWCLIWKDRCVRRNDGPRLARRTLEVPRPGGRAVQAGAHPLEVTAAACAAASADGE
jgi:hypothetical protein